MSFGAAATLRERSETSPPTPSHHRPMLASGLPFHVISHHALASGSDQVIVTVLLWSANQIGGLTSMSRNDIPRSRAPGAYSAR